jgi:hypothetical protein
MNRNKKQQTPAKPFFTRFLEKQELHGVAGGQPDQTLKFPSDSDETLADSVNQTLKFPSDLDETAADDQ